MLTTTPCHIYNSIYKIKTAYFQLCFIQLWLLILINNLAIDKTSQFPEVISHPVKNSQLTFREVVHWIFYSFNWAWNLIWTFFKQKKQLHSKDLYIISYWNPWHLYEMEQDLKSVVSIKWRNIWSGRHAPLIGQVFNPFWLSYSWNLVITKYELSPIF